MVDHLAKAYGRIEKYIKECGYTYTVEDIVWSYGAYYLRRCYMSYTTQDVVLKHKPYLNALYRYGVKNGLYSNEESKKSLEWKYY